ncbi:prephenate dehydrogenase/arogenate dehydrogenase family protein [Thiomicrospira sp. R3]|uniref:prephenate dehydrogenase n=1 Tax=Thiomicrospira sp. R3 TaxID=3035472 RepID=UPI00259BEB48|nr:prephenate dehydrogenase/arogenate dehydrogenase family protein [Thiomicrospira sp. R3]WFE68589.1 prephenate dehydrogenase/arogenate dehydrogenase family protein [Thiomicrospira sp. R3]
MYVQRLAVIGVGLIGGSFALKLKQLGLVGEVVGYGRNLENLEKAIQLGVIDYYEADLLAAVKDADLIVLAVPLASIAPIYAQIAQGLKPGAIVTDVGSAKFSVVKQVEFQLGYQPSFFVPGHPIAGREKSGVEAVEADLYLNHRVILTPQDYTEAHAISMVESLWTAVGAQVTRMTAQYHDDVFAATSHLPHMLAFALVDMLNEHPELGNVFQYTAGGFRDFTRIASSDATMWRDIALQNSSAIVKWLAAYQVELSKLSHLIEKAQGEELYNLFFEAKAARGKHILNKF